MGERVGGEGGHGREGEGAGWCVKAEPGAGGGGGAGAWQRQGWGEGWVQGMGMVTGDACVCPATVHPDLQGQGHRRCLCVPSPSAS